ncbi:MAG: Mannan endo-1,4-beta-mannosidase precursor [Bacteroidetes bacterium ADurb.Bin217]|nr:MAG: Mannan endo-1,4-beta-mannosidase precursor [Bacteroidetes bacterium ADurb.Bin217]
MKKLLFSGLFVFVFIFTSYPQGFTTDNTTGNLLDANGNNFIMKGINVPLSWYQTNVNNSIASLKTNTGSNCLRIVVNAGYNGTTATPANVWQTAVQACIDNDMIPMIELHDWTGSTNTTTDFTNMANWYVTNAAYFKQANIAKHILINICNEWGTWQTANSNGTAWRDGFNQAVTLIRNAGINTTLIIDAVGYGQDIDDAKNIKAYAASMINADPQKNLLFSVHMYCEWRKGGDDITGTLQWMRTNKIPFIVGEFGYQHATDGSCDIDEQLIMDQCQAKGIGWLAWSQKGNSTEVAYLDLCGDWDCRAATLSAWGNTVINGTNGTKTAVTCSVFTNTAPTVSLSAPTNGASFAALSAITVSATASDSDGTISKVEFYANNELIGTDNTSPYSISWSAAAGSYSITAKAYDNAGAITTSTARTITVNQPATITAGGPTTFCSGGSVVLQANTGVGYTYQWRKDASNITGATASSYTATQSGTYTVIVTANSLSTTSTGTSVTVNTTPAAPTITNTTPTVCVGATISLSIPTTTGATYAWSGPSSYAATTATISRTNATTAMSGTYSATVTVNGCTSTASTTTVTVNAIPTAPTVTSPVTYQQNATATPLTATGTGLKWYTVSTGGTGNITAPTPSTATIGTTTHYVSQTVSGCESPRASIAVIIENAIITQTINLEQGWNIISINVHPSDSTFATIFNGKQVIIKNASGFWKSGNTTELNSIHKIIPGEGYLVHSSAIGTIQIIGTAMQTNNYASLNTGWNLLGCPFQTTTAMSTYFNTTNTETIKNMEGYWEPNNALSTISNIVPGNGYYIKKK